MRTNKFLQDKDWLYKKYVEEKLSSGDIAEIASCTPQGVLLALKRYNIEIKNNKENLFYRG